MATEEKKFIDVDEKTKTESKGLPNTKVRKIRCAYCKQEFANFVLVKKHIKVCQSNPNNP